MPKLTERRHLQTRTDIAHAAVDLFVRNGFESTTMADVAEAAGVSRRTVYRHFPTKDDLVFEYPRRWLEHYERELETRSEHESLRDLNRRALLSVAGAIEADRNDVLAAFSVRQANETLGGTHQTHDERWTQRLVELFTAEPAFEPHRLTEVAVVAAATVAGTNTAIALWALAQAAPLEDTDKPSGSARLPDITTAVLDQLDPIWPDEFC